MRKDLNMVIGEMIEMSARYKIGDMVRLVKAAGSTKGNGMKDGDLGVVVEDSGVGYYIDVEARGIRRWYVYASEIELVKAKKDMLGCIGLGYADGSGTVMEISGETYVECLERAIIELGWQITRREV